MLRWRRQSAQEDARRVASATQEALQGKILFELIQVRRAEAS